MSAPDEPQVPRGTEPGPADSDAGEASGAPDGAEEESPGRIVRRGGGTPAAEPGADAARATGGAPRAMIPARGNRPPVEAALMRVIATAGIVGISVAIAAIMGSQHSKTWLIGLVASVVSVVLAAVLWSSRRV